jgi:hypothetical protein
MAKQQAKAPEASVEYVEWDDAVADIGWERRSDVALAVQKCASIGRVVREDDQTVVIAGTWGLDSTADEDTNCRIAIPKGWISRRIRLKI